METIYLQRKERVINFIPNLYVHDETEWNMRKRSCWQCKHAFVTGDVVHVAITDKGPNRCVCTPCAAELGLVKIDAPTPPADDSSKGDVDDSTVRN